jgi:hypothetical protein
MASIKLKHTSGNGTILNSPAANPSSDITLKLPSTTGSAGQVLQVASANHSSTNAELEFAAAAGGKFASYAIIRDEKNAANGGTFTSGAWRTRDLNTEVADADGIVSISNNQFTLQAGTYLIKASTPAYESEFHQNRLYNVTDSSVVDTGSSAYTKVTSYVQTNSILSTRFTISGAKVFEIQHQTDSTKSSQGFGVRTSAGFTTDADIYTIVEIYKES